MDSVSQFTALAPHYDELMQAVPYEAWADYVMLLFSMVEHRPHRVLDCACGTGNVTFELARRKLLMTGVDASEPMLQVAREKAKILSTSLPVRFLHADLTNFQLGETFDAATCLYDSLNYILDPRALQAAFGCIAAHLEPDGIFIFDMNSEYAFKANLFTQRNYDPRRRIHYNWRANFNEETRICTVSMEFKRTAPDGTEETFDEVHRERAYPRVGVEAMLAATGWQLLHTFDAYTLNRPHERSERWYFVARRIK